MKLIVLGTSSGAGKTLMSAVYCRHLFRLGKKVAPFKGFNLSATTFETETGEIGIGQAFQALACNIIPDIRMNPVLLKSKKGGMQLLLNGKPAEGDVEARVKVACDSFDSLSKEYEAIVCEGSGSPAELNILDKDVANIRMAKERNIPAVLIADIERGGVFAAVYGTWRIIPEESRHLLKGYIINRFRGDSSILKSGIDKIEELTGMKCYGIMPYIDLKFPEEDSLSDSGGKIGDGDPKTEFLVNLDELTDIAEKALDFDHIDEIASSA